VILGLIACASVVGERHTGQEVIYLYVDDGDLESADLLLQDCWPVERYEPWCIEGMPDWDEDPYDENYWQMVFYALRPLRHLLWAYYETGDTVYRDRLIAILHDFLDTYPTYDPHWDEHTAAFRAMMLVDVYWKFHDSGDLDDELAVKLEELIFGTARFLYEPAHFDNDYNHGFTETAALLLIAANFPDEDQGSGCGSSWSATALRRLDRLMEDAVDEDGVEAEQSPYYHMYVLSFAWQIFDWADAYDVPVSAFFRDRIDDMVHYATYVAAPDGTVPMVGSSLGCNIRNYQPTIFDSLAALDPEFEYVRTAGLSGVEPESTSKLFESSGQWVARSAFGPNETYEQQTHLVFDVGPFRTAHSHLDALSLHLYGAGRVLLPDSGLYSYEEDPNHDYFFGTRAHNTVVVDGGDQAEGSATRLMTAEGDRWAYTAGRHTLVDGVQHDRGVLLLHRDVVIVLDSLRSDAEHDYAQTWHLFPGAEVEGDIADLWIEDEEGLPVLRIVQMDPGTQQLDVLFGEEDPIQGWYSDYYEEIEPNHALEYHQDEADALFVTALVAGPDPDAEVSLDLQLEDSDAHLRVQVGDEVREAWFTGFLHNGGSIDVE